MTVAATCFKWVDLLENQFDKSWIELDTTMSTLEDDEDFYDIYAKSRRHAASLASCFSQLSHKASVVFQNNAKLEAELIHLREETASNRATIEQISKEKTYLSKALQSSLAKNHKLTHPTEEASEEVPSDPVPLASSAPLTPPVRDSELCSRLISENERLRTDVIELESEMVGARLDNVYLDKVKYREMLNANAYNYVFTSGISGQDSANTASAGQQHAGRREGENVDTD